MNIHILGIGGTFMAGIALLARSLGHSVRGSDGPLYPPMSTQLETHGIEVCDGFRPEHLQPAPDLVIVGNAMSRGNPAVEYMLDQGLPFASGPAWLAGAVLHGRHVCAISGTHGKTTTAALLAWILESDGRAPGFLIGGIAENFGVSARLGDSKLFVVEADEYDTAFFDKRSKFIHYLPKILVVNNIEYDHADIFADIADIRRQFHHLLRTVPGSGRLLVKAGDANIEAVLDMGCWTPLERFGDEGDWTGRPLRKDWSSFDVSRRKEPVGTVDWRLIGRHNADNALAAIAAAVVVGVDPGRACAHAGAFQSARRRLQRLGTARGVTVYDDFAHHPTAIRATLEALRQHVDRGRIIAILEPRSNSMKLGAYRNDLGPALSGADLAFVYRPEGLKWDLQQSVAALGGKCTVCDSVAQIVDSVLAGVRPGDHLLVMSNGDFGGIHRRLLERLEA